MKLFGMLGNTSVKTGWRLSESSSPGIAQRANLLGSVALKGLWNDFSLQLHLDYQEGSDIAIIHGSSFSEFFLKVPHKIYISLPLF